MTILFYDFSSALWQFYFLYVCEYFIICPWQQCSFFLELYPSSIVLITLYSPCFFHMCPISLWVLIPVFSPDLSLQFWQMCKTPLWTSSHQWSMDPQTQHSSNGISSLWLPFPKSGSLPVSTNGVDTFTQTTEVENLGNILCFLLSWSLPIPIIQPSFFLILHLKYY